MAIKKQDIWYLFLQIIPVMIGVYLGFWLSERGVKSHTDEQVQKLETLIIDELKSNQEMVTAKLGYHEMLRDTLRVFVNSEITLDRSRLYKTFNGLQPPLLKEACYQSGIQTGLLTNFDLDIVALLNEIMAEQKSLNKYTDSAIAALLSTGSFDDEGFNTMLERVLLNLNDMTSFEVSLIKKYNTTLKKME